MLRLPYDIDMSAWDPSVRRATERLLEIQRKRDEFWARIGRDGRDVPGNSHIPSVALDDTDPPAVTAPVDASR